jgi:hypothetical protein
MCTTDYSVFSANRWTARRSKRVAFFWPLSSCTGVLPCRAHSPPASPAPPAPPNPTSSPPPPCATRNRALTPQRPGFTPSRFPSLPPSQSSALRRRRRTQRQPSTPWRRPQHSRPSCDPAPSPDLPWTRILLLHHHHRRRVCLVRTRAPSPDLARTCILHHLHRRRRRRRVCLVRTQAPPPSRQVSQSLQCESSVHQLFLKIEHCLLLLRRGFTPSFGIAVDQRDLPFPRRRKRAIYP